MWIVYGIFYFIIIDLFVIKSRCNKMNCLFSVVTLQMTNVAINLILTYVNMFSKVVGHRHLFLGRVGFWLVVVCLPSTTGWW